MYNLIYMHLEITYIIRFFDRNLNKSKNLNCEKYKHKDYLKRTRACSHNRSDYLEIIYVSESDFWM